MLTKVERKKLAKAARGLASEFAEGRGPSLIAGSWCGCALAKVVDKAGIPNINAYPYASQRVAIAVEHTESGDDMVSDATRHEVGVDYIYGWHPSFEHIPGAVVFPLLWLADKLEDGIA